VFYAWVVDGLNDGSIESCIVQRHSIGAACDFVQAFDDPMPENAYELLVSLAAGARCSRTRRPVLREWRYLSQDAARSASEAIGMNSI
jgi:hypothetical protein